MNRQRTSNGTRRLAFAFSMAMLAGSAVAETHTVLANSVSFSPDAIEVAPGDTITWQYNTGYPHTVTSGESCVADGLFYGELGSPGDTVTWEVPLDASGAVPYFCEPHCGSGMSGVITVVSDGTVINVPDDYPTIQAGIDAANDGDTVLIAAGTYNEAGITLNGKAITVRGELGEDGTHLTVIDGQGASAPAVMACVDGEGLDTVIEALHLTGGSGSYGGGLYFYLNSSGTVNNCLFTNNYSYHTGGATTAYVNCSPAFNNCTFRDNEAGRFGGAALSTYDCYVTFTDCIFENNFAAKGGGAVASYQSTTYIRCVISGNSAAVAGGIYSTIFPEYLTDTVVCGNTPTQVDGEWVDNGGNVIEEICPSDCPGDVDGNGEVGVDDLLLLLGEYGTDCSSGCDSDLDGNGAVNVDDLLEMLGYYGDQCG
ncbi:MAG: plastocyanin/azurin family copper-binding protein [Phycisphaerales bacterium]|nr:plastocyanin/azurin family copper-binding protein [Phycisphaerales bacterium]